MKKAELIELLDNLLKLEDFKKADISLNGIQVDNSKDEIKKIGFAVDASYESIEEAKKNKCDMLFVHHGLFWGKPLSIRGSHYKRVASLIKNDILLYAVHLPLDAHEEYGNNYSMAKKLNLKNLSPFGEYHGVKIGVKGELAKAKSIDEIAKILGFSDENDLKILPFGKKDNIKKIAIISGGAASEGDLIAALEEEADLYITGEHQHILYHVSKENEISMLSGGHYLTETYGVKSVSEFLTSKGLNCIFIDIPTGM